MTKCGFPVQKMDILTLVSDSSLPEGAGPVHILLLLCDLSFLSLNIPLKIQMCLIFSILKNTLLLYSCLIISSSSLLSPSFHSQAF